MAEPRTVEDRSARPPRRLAARFARAALRQEALQDFTHSWCRPDNAVPGIPGAEPVADPARSSSSRGGRAGPLPHEGQRKRHRAGASGEHGLGSWARDEDLLVTARATCPGKRRRLRRKDRVSSPPERGANAAEVSVARPGIGSPRAGNWRTSSSRLYASTAAKRLPTGGHRSRNGDRKHVTQDNTAAGSRLVWSKEGARIPFNAETALRKYLERDRRRPVQHYATARPASETVK